MGVEVIKAKPGLKSVSFKHEDELESGVPIGPVWMEYEGRSEPAILREDEVLGRYAGWLSLPQARDLAAHFKVELELV